MNKKVISIIAIIALVAILATCLVACNAESYQKKLEKAGYTVTVVEADEDDKEEGIEWTVQAMKGISEYVAVTKFASADDAKAAVEKAEAAGTLLGAEVIVKRTGSIVIAGTEQGVKDAQ